MVHKLFHRACLALLAASILGAQEYRATLSGTVIDPQGAAVPNAQVVASNIETGVEIKSASNHDGTYTVPFLTPGSYTLRVQAAGFRPYQMGPIELQVSDHTRVEIHLEIGAASNQVVVSATAPLVEAGNGDRGQVVTGQELRDLPTNGKTPFNFINLAPGVVYSASNTLTLRPFDNGAINNYSINGGAYSRNEFQIDGVPDIAYTAESNSRQDVAYVPPAESTQEFKVVTNSYDAQYGRTSGGIISVSTKTGSNQFHGAAYEYLQRTSLSANVFSGNANNVPRSPNSVDQYGGNITGPVKKDKTFFMFGIERYHQIQPAPLIGSVPTDLQHQGDFSQTLNAAGKLTPIYDPLTAHPNPTFDPTKPVSLTNLQTIRDAFPGNKVPTNRMDPVALKILQDIPSGNRPGDPVTGLNNWYAGSVGTLNNFQNLISRVDQTFNEKWRAYVRWDHNYRDGGVKNANGWDTPAASITHNYRYNDGAAVNVVNTLNPSTVFSATIGFNRFLLGSIHTNQDLSSLGFPSTVTGQVQLPTLFPVVSFENYLTAGTAITDITPSETYVINGAILKVVRNHSLKFGAEYRNIHFADESFANASGNYAFTHNWTSSNPQVNDPNSGNAIASFLLGDMNAGSAALNSTPYLTWHYPATFLQDDWQLSSRLTINLGLRWDFEAPPVERYNRQNRGFAFNTPSPIQVPGLNLDGGLLFAGVGQPRAAFNPDYTDWQPRLGAAYRVFDSKPLVLRSGIGRYYLPTTEYGGVTGYSQTTTVQTTTSTFLPFATLSNPFPSGLIQPIGSSQGLATNAGATVEFSDPTRRIPYVWQYTGGLQFQPAASLLVAVSYAGSQTRKLEVSHQLDYLTLAQLALGEAYLSTSVTNPFFGILPTNTTLGGQSKVARSALLTQYPQFSSVLEDNSSIGKSWYNSLQAKMQHRLHNGLTLLAAYTWSKNMTANQYRNPQDAALSRELAFYNVPQRLGPQRNL